MKKLYVRVLPKTGVETFHRCAMPFTRAWSVVEVDAATEKRLNQEQMLEVATEQPEDFEAAVPADATEGGEADKAAANKATADATKSAPAKKR